MQTGFGTSGRLTLRRFLALLTAIILSLSAAAQQNPWTFNGIERVVALSDVHGDFHAMQATLASAGVIDADGAWSAANTHLIITGDLLDRGPDSRPVMDMVMRLEGEAQAAGGAVHLLLGNHEVMNLVGDLRYVADAEYAAFAADEDPEERELWYQRFLASLETDEEKTAARAQFDERHPPGFFGHRRAFRSDGHYGAWLLGKPLIVVVNETAFVHGGISPIVGELGLDGINGSLMSEVASYVTALETLVDAGVMDPAENFYRQPGVAAALLELPVDPAVITAAETLVSLSDSAIHSPESPLWYRGNVGCPAPVEQGRLNSMLRGMGANRVVIGHTPTSIRRILSRLDGMVLEIDTGMLKDYYKGSGQALVFEGETLQVIGEDGEVSEPVSHPRRVGLRPGGLSAAALERLLETGDVVLGEALTRDMMTAKVSADGVTVDALFIEDPRGKGFVPELAAYQLDRFLSLDMVPVAVAREVDGESGVLQLKPARSLNEGQRREAGRGASAWCPLADQWGAMYVFDALVHNPGRPLENMLYSQDNWQLMLNGHSKSFGYSKRLPGYLDNVELAIGGFWQERLEALTEQTVEEAFADTLDRRRRRALNGRRDQLLKEAEK